MMTDHMTDLKKALRGIVKECFGDVKVLSVAIDQDEDFEGDEILRITIFVDADDLDVTKLSSFTRLVRDRLTSKLNEDRFPVMSFVSGAEARRTAGAAA